MNERPSFDEMCTELDELAAVPTDVLAAWVTDRGRCLWESTFGDPPEWTGEDEPDRELATRMCAGCPVRAECLELELRVGGAETVGVWGALNEDDRRALHAVWVRRRRAELEAMPDEEAP
jgi:WhiB family transcriptional regulator, redox-sensing transcriptional regulator